MRKLTETIQEFGQRDWREFTVTEEGLIDRNGELWVTPPMASQIAGNTPGAIRIAIRRGTLPAVVVNFPNRHYYYVKKTDVIAWNLTKPHHPKTRKRRSRNDS